ncbi:hypothetical protein LCGC14_1320250 [marine sediment metagenome]|uniref:Helix-turn-helix domain-containing protein n=1 Tax=marine sediment metagenome TaxID=412755 RepID=A0A0F9KJS8_9ZZZZ
MDEIYSPAKVAEILNISEDAVKQLMEEGVIHAQRTKRKWRTTHSCVVEYILRGCANPDTFELEESDAK